MTFPSLASIETTYDFLIPGRAEPLFHRLRHLIRHAHHLLLALCARRSPPATLLHVNEDEPKSPIIPVFTSQPRSLATYCQQRGFMVRPIVAPTVPKGSERIRVCLHAANTKAEIEGLVQTIEAWIFATMSGASVAEGGNGRMDVRESQVQTPQQAAEGEKAKL